MTPNPLIVQVSTVEPVRHMPGVIKLVGYLLGTEGGPRGAVVSMPSGDHERLRSGDFVQLHGRQLMATDVAKVGDVPFDLFAAKGFSFHAQALPVIETAEFIRWFGQSKITDTAGKPLVVYHGTNQSFDVFDAARSQHENGFVFATNRADVASDFALYKSVWQGANVMPLYARADSLLEVDGQYQPIRIVESQARLEGMEPGESLREFAQRSGYQAVVIRNTTDDVGLDVPPISDVFMFLPGSQLKSAIGNMGTFDPGDPSVLRSMVAEVRSCPLSADYVLNGNDVKTLSRQALLDSFAQQFPTLAPAVGDMLRRGFTGERGGLVLIEKATPDEIARVFAQKTGRPVGGMVNSFSGADRTNGFFDPQSGLTFLVAENLTTATAPAVVLHEMMHSQQTDQLMQRAHDLLIGRHRLDDPKVRGFLDRVADRMYRAGVGMDRAEAAAYIVEQAALEGRDSGHSFASDAFVSWSGQSFGQVIGQLIGGFVNAIKGWFCLTPSQEASLTLDELVRVAKAGVEQAAKGFPEQAQFVVDPKAANAISFSFAGSNARTANLDNLAQAKEMRARGCGNESIRMATGWHVGLDSRWRFEISDDKAQWVDGRSTLFQRFVEENQDRVSDDGQDDAGLYVSTFTYDDGFATRSWGHTQQSARHSGFVHAAKKLNVPWREFNYGVVTGQTYQLNEVLNHEELFSAYPDIGSVRIKFLDKDDPALDDYDGVYFSDDSILLNASLSPDAALSVLLHEIQHAIQEREGFAMGGNSSTDFSGKVRSLLENEPQGYASDESRWLSDNMQAVMARDALLADIRNAGKYQSVERLMAYANSDAPSGKFRLIRNEIQWIYGEEFRGNPGVRDLEDLFYGIPSRGYKRNERIMEIAYQAAQLIRESIPSNDLKKFRESERPIKNILASLERRYNKLSGLDRPLWSIRQQRKDAERVRERHQFSSSYGLYRHLAGEVEARQAQARIKLTSQERQNRAVDQDYDVKPEDVIVVFRGWKTQRNLTLLEDAAETCCSAPCGSSRPDFTDWIAGTKVVDKFGAPQVVYHGTDARFEDYRPSLSGTAGTGVYFGDAEAAQAYGSTVKSAYVNLRNPWVIKGDYDSAVTITEDLDNPIIEAVLELPGGRELVDQLKASGDVFFGVELTRTLESLGYDGIMVDYGDCQEVVAFAPEQIQSEESVKARLAQRLAGTQVAHPDGTPLLVYHGTDAQFDALRDGITYFTPSTDYSYIKNSERVISGYVQINNPYRAESVSQIEQLRSFPERVEALKAQGYDGVIWAHPDNILRGGLGWGDDRPQVVIFNSEQFVQVGDTACADLPVQETFGFSSMLQDMVDVKNPHHLAQGLDGPAVTRNWAPVPG